MSLPASEKYRVRLDFLDGLRGLAALFVVLHHIWGGSFIDPNHTSLPRWFRLLTPLECGHSAVGVFIVLSGFCLMMPVARSGGKYLPKGFWDYIKRRARRILPPYYAALCFSVLLLALIPGLRVSNGTVYSDYNGPDMIGSVISHLVLAHNLNVQWNWRINGPMWSVATEWQIYFVFPLLLLPLWKKFGRLVPIVVGILLGVASFYFPCLQGACYWYIGLFAMGMAAAELSFSPELSEKVRNVRWSVISALFAALTCAVLIHCYKIGADWDPLADSFLGLATASFLIYGAQSFHFADNQPVSWILRSLASRHVVFLGGFSYSLYLTHFPLLQIMSLDCKALHLSTPQAFVWTTCTGLPLFIGVAYLFHLAFERRFMSLPQDNNLTRMPSLTLPDFQFPHRKPVAGE